MNKRLCVHRAVAVIQLHNSIGVNKIIVKQLGKATPQECLKIAAAKLVTAIQYPNTDFCTSCEESLGMRVKDLEAIYNKLALEECHCDETQV